MYVTQSMFQNECYTMSVTQHIMNVPQRMLHNECYTMNVP